MAKRKSISKKTRFEVFKRDKFTCQYCGRKAPDVILEVDHIKPVADGGGNDIMNLITSCFDCNRGKGKRKLDDKTVVQKQQAQLEELAARNEQLEMMLEWREELMNFRQKEVDAVSAMISRMSKFGLNEHGKAGIQKLISQFSLEEVLDATEIAMKRYYNGTKVSAEEAISKIGGICYNRRTFAGNQSYYFNYLKKALYRKFPDFGKDNLPVLKTYVVEIGSDEEFNQIKKIMDECECYEELEWHLESMRYKK